MNPHLLSHTMRKRDRPRMPCVNPASVLQKHQTEQPANSLGYSRPRTYSSLTCRAVQRCTSRCRIDTRQRSMLRRPYSCTHLHRRHCGLPIHATSVASRNLHGVSKRWQPEYRTTRGAYSSASNIRQPKPTAVQQSSTKLRDNSQAFTRTSCCNACHPRLR